MPIPARSTSTYVQGGHSTGARWALQVRPGDKVGIRGPVGRVIPQANWYLLVGDETALRAIARKPERLPTDANGIAVIEVADRSEESVSGTAAIWRRCRH